MTAQLHAAPDVDRGVLPLHGTARERLRSGDVAGSSESRRAGGRVARFGSVDELLADARSRLERIYVEDVPDQLASGARVVDIRPAWQRAAEGEIPGSLVVERNHLEWRLHPESSARLPQAVEGQRWIVVCSEGYTSSLAADALNSLAVPATDLVGGFRAWQAAGLPTSATVTDANHCVPCDPSDHDEAGVG
jgi:rhodanese-related sulfurtransferase